MTWAIVIYLQLGVFHWGGWKTEEACLAKMKRLEEIWAGQVIEARCEVEPPKPSPVGRDG